MSDRIPGTDRYYCDLSPRFRWTRTLEGPTLNAAIAQYLASYTSVPNRTPGAVREVTVGSHTPSGRVGTITITTERGNFVVRGNDIRFVLRRPGGEILNSTYFSVETMTSADGTLARLTIRGNGLRARRRHVPVGRDRTRARRSGFSNDSSNLLSRHYGWSRQLAAGGRSNVVGAAGCGDRYRSPLSSSACALPAPRSRCSISSIWTSCSSCHSAPASGSILPSQVEPTAIYGLSADYGEIAPQLAHRLRRELLGVALSRRRRAARSSTR